jgi:hypothetical protein
MEFRKIGKICIWKIKRFRKLIHVKLVVFISTQNPSEEYVLKRLCSLSRYVHIAQKYTENWLISNISET